MLNCIPNTATSVGSLEIPGVSLHLPNVPRDDTAFLVKKGIKTISIEKHSERRACLHVQQGFTAAHLRPRSKHECLLGTFIQWVANYYTLVYLVSTSPLRIQAYSGWTKQNS